MKPNWSRTTLPPTSDRKCSNCGITETPEWRRGPDGQRSLCNACGLHFAKVIRKSSLHTGILTAPSSATTAASSASISTIIGTPSGGESDPLSILAWASTQIR
jgi:hypothetical protein